ncbi:hypothetical protein BASA50_002281 [Batrachochytrium salamandrivorans]|uniref:OTU domain-containing protein n=1 Tax=Batrachochytrium salamandrivorans TaxID=1357716 RepID=A0ABQ8FLQ9_9FUNG|nr:hypothetical protein BASA60_003785 [Batrachochytrium salamandrivorans]KAH6600458.1 hypothetical protein BASA50_002281 [Batrachochytrium salamandrivorans]KAH9270773.1 hypothetical protein BASA83_007135 [Batrachochytrium salamandrivorans]
MARKKRQDSGRAAQKTTKNELKNVNHSFTDDNTTQLDCQLAELGLVIKDITGDGNCLFRALSDQLYGTPTRHGQCRIDTCSHIAAYKDLYDPFIDNGDSLEKYIAKMSKGGVYGGNMEIVAFARHHKVNVAVHQAGLPVWVISGTISENSPSRQPMLHIAYHSWEHYSSIRNRDGPFTDMPCISIRPSGNVCGSIPKSKAVWDRAENEPPTHLETVAMNTTGVHDLPKVRALFSKFRGDPGRVIDQLYEDLELETELLPENQTPPTKILEDTVQSSIGSTCQLAKVDIDEIVGPPQLEQLTPNDSIQCQSALTDTKHVLDTIPPKKKNRPLAREKRDQARKAKKQASVQKKREKANPSCTGNSMSESAEITTKSMSASSARDELIDKMHSIHI